jgi:DNA-binding transcriptional regulator YdaS (Cro superfamily)
MSAFAIKIGGMTLSEYFSGKHGLTVSELGKAIGVKGNAQIWQWRHGHLNRRPDPINAVLIERATGGLVSRQDLRPDDWQRIWPELADQSPAGQGV